LAQLGLSRPATCSPDVAREDNSCAKLYRQPSLFFIKQNPKFSNSREAENFRIAFLFLSFEKIPFISSFEWDSTVLTVASTAGAAAVCKLYKIMQTANFKKEMHVTSNSLTKLSGSLAVKLCSQIARTRNGTPGKGGNLESKMA